MQTKPPDSKSKQADRLSTPAIRRAVANALVLSILGLVTATGLSGCQLTKTSKGVVPTTPLAGAQTKGSSIGLIPGAWQISYSVGGETQSAHVTFTQSSTGFEGTGTDDSDGKAFVVDTGFLAGKTVGFHKRYHVDENPNLPPIVYDGTYEMVANDAYKGPYMKGTYKLESPPTQGEWDAQKVENQVASGQTGQTSATPAAQQAPPPVIVDPNKAPDISGKWDSGYEYMFKTFHSRMFLEQDGSKISGHGADKNTNESYAITGTYNFPNIKIIHKYPVLKLGKGKTKPARTLEFRGTIQVVNEADYQGPRMTGKNMGGGDWMAEEVR